MKKIWYGALLTGSFAFAAIGAEEFKIHARFDFEEAAPQHYNQEIYYEPGAVDKNNCPALFSKAWPIGKKDFRLKMNIVDNGYGSGHALEVAPNADAQIIFLLGFGSIPSHPDLKVVFCYFVPEDSENTLKIYIGNPVLKKNMETMLPSDPGKWMYVKHIINGPNYFTDGTPVNNFGIESPRGNSRKWRIDNLILWSGQDTTPPSRVGGLQVLGGAGGNRISWSAASDNLFVVKYRVYRGSVAGFTADSRTEIGATAELEFLDSRLMRPEYYYVIRGEDCDGNLSEPSIAVKAVKH